MSTVFCLIFLVSFSFAAPTFYGTGDRIGPVVFDPSSPSVVPIYPSDVLQHTLSTSGALDAKNGIYYHVLFNLTTDVTYLWSTDLKTKKLMYSIPLPFVSRDRSLPDQSITVNAKSGQIYVFGSVCGGIECFNQTILELNPQTQKLNEVVTLKNFYKPYFFNPVIDPIEQKIVWLAQTGINNLVYNGTLWSLSLNSPSTPPVQITIPYDPFTLDGFTWDDKLQMIVGTADISNQPFIGKETVAVIDTKANRFKATLSITTGDLKTRSELIFITSNGQGQGYKIMSFQHNVIDISTWLVVLNFQTGEVTQVSEMKNDIHGSIVCLHHSSQQF